MASKDSTPQLMPVNPIFVISTDLKSPDYICQGPNGNLYINNLGKRSIQVVKDTGEVLFSFGSEGSGDGQFLHPFGIAVSNDVIYVSDVLRHMIQAFSLDGKFLKKYANEGVEPGQLADPTGMYYDHKAGHLYVADSANNRVQVFDKDLNPLQCFGVGKLVSPRAIDFLETGDCVVLDEGETCIHVFNSAFEKVKDFAKNGTDIINSWDLTSAISKHIIVSDDGVNAIKVFSLEGQLVCSFGGVGSEPGQFGSDSPTGICADKKDRLYVCDKDNNCIKVFNCPKL